MKHTYFTDHNTNITNWESCRAGQAQDVAAEKRKELTYCAMAGLFVTACNLHKRGHSRDLRITIYPFISWLLSLIFPWPDEDRRCALTPNWDGTAPHPRYQGAPLWPWWPRSDHQGARCLSRCCCLACASVSLLQGAPCPPACAASAPCAAPPALPQTPAGVRLADVAAQWTWTTAAKHIVSMLIVKCFSQGPSIIHRRI